MSDKMISKIIKHYSLYIYDDTQAIIVDMVQGWIREVNINFGRASHMERLGDSCTRCTFFVKQTCTVHEIDFVKS